MGHLCNRPRRNIHIHPVTVHSTLKANKATAELIQQLSSAAAAVAAAKAVVAAAVHQPNDVKEESAEAAMEVATAVEQPNDAKYVESMNIPVETTTET